VYRFAGAKPTNPLRFSYVACLLARSAATPLGIALCLASLTPSLRNHLGLAKLLGVPMAAWRKKIVET